jgi:SprT protein
MFFCESISIKMQAADSIRERYKVVLERYIPEAAIERIIDWIIGYGVHLTITRERSTKHGDFRPVRGKSSGHKITVNHSLNKYAFLITLVHEIAHFDTWVRFGDSVSPHGQEWKNSFKKLMQDFLHERVFPSDVLRVLEIHMLNPSASSSRDLVLMKALKNYDTELCIFLEQLEENQRFRLLNGREFIKGPKERKTFRCFEVPSMQAYRIHALAEVEPVYL